VNKKNIDRYNVNKRVVYVFLCKIHIYLYIYIYYIQVYVISTVIIYYGHIALVLLFKSFLIKLQYVLYHNIIMYIGRVRIASFDKSTIVVVYAIECYLLALQF